MSLFLIRYDTPPSLSSMQAKEYLCQHLIRGVSIMSDKSWEPGSNLPQRFRTMFSLSSFHGAPAETLELHLP